MNKSKKHNEKDELQRRRGRPSGKNRVPLSLEERRARNALYERERRNEAADAMTQLAEVAGCDPNISNAELLATVVSKIQRCTGKDSEDNIENIIRINNNLTSQIATLEAQLSDINKKQNILQLDTVICDSQPPVLKLNSKTNGYCSAEKKQNKKRQKSEHNKRINKRAKTQSESTDSGIDLQRQSVSPTELCVEHNKQILTLVELQPVTKTNEEENKTRESCYSQQLASELYNQFYNSDSPNFEQTESEWIRANIVESPLETLKRSLFEIPSIVSPIIPKCSEPKQETPPIDINIEPPPDLNILNNAQECQILPTVKMNMDFLTDTDKELIRYWLDDESSETDAVNYQNKNNTTTQSVSDNKRIVQKRN